jgi:DeoR/GlpR family transcriptional regulator of sugar metabolism
MSATLLPAQRRDRARAAGRNRPARLMIAAAHRVVLPAGAAKCSMSGVVRVCGPEAIDHAVTDAPLRATCRSAVEKHRVEVTLA